MKATSPDDATLPIFGVVLFLTLALTLLSSNVFAQYDTQQNHTKKPQTARAVKPIINQPSPASGAGNESGLGDRKAGLFFSPARLDSVIQGTGAICVLPPMNDSMLGADISSTGPTLVVMSERGPWVFGALVNNRLSSDESSGANSISTLIQPFINYNLSGGWYLNAVPTLTEMCGSKHLTMPLGPSIGKVHCFGELPVSMQLGAYYNAEKSQEGSEWQVHFQIQFPFPE